MLKITGMFLRKSCLVMVLVVRKIMGRALPAHGQHNGLTEGSHFYINLLSWIGGSFECKPVFFRI